MTTYDLTDQIDRAAKVGLTPEQIASHCGAKVHWSAGTLTAGNTGAYYSVMDYIAEREAAPVAAAPKVRTYRAMDDATDPGQYSRGYIRSRRASAAACDYSTDEAMESEQW